ncbi:MAG: PorV/PorQ family protein [Bacteroidetes bacterium]|nr:PorV/PorQ family protein [Bacteroidota bacterium]MBS1629844.1 PorV/PorQ family protein [Bacteroidota bacterium]
MIPTIAKKVLAATAFAALSIPAFAGNKDRSGQSGAPELLINPWAASTGVFGANTACVTGIEAMKGNIAGLAFTDKFDIGVSHTTYLKGSGISVIDAAIGVNLGDAGVVGLNMQALNFGEIQVTDYNHPYGGEIGTYKPSFFNVEIGYAKEFSHSIHAGVAATFVSEKITNAGAMGAAFEAGVQYVTGLQDNFHFGVTLRNIGTNMKFSGPGFSFDSESPDGTYEISRQTPSERFEMPTYLNIGAAYDFYLDGKHLAKEDDKPKQRLTAMLGFTSNSFNNDYIHAGLEYSFREMVMLRAGYRYEKDIASDENTTTFYTGFSAGASVMTHLGANGPKLAIDYSFRPTHRPDNGVHVISLRFMLPKTGKATDAAE